MLLKGYFTTVISSKHIDKNAKARIIVSNNGICVAFFTAKIKRFFSCLTRKTIKNNPFCISFINCITGLSPFMVNDPLCLHIVPIVMIPVVAW